ncbi:hypothetical protein [Paenirhodobacter sp.]|uniref:urease accessory protein UreE C-terminal domain-containing protein n=1 Tax=Paenirhodobacter sp. TaxID=1965326 RepID=UPI003B3D236D
MTGINTPVMTQQLMEVRGDIVLAALCIGQFHAPCQIDGNRLLVLAEAPLRQVLQTLGLELNDTDEPFTPVPCFAPEAGAHGAARRAVQTHALLDTDDYVPTETDRRGSNA